MKPETIKAIFTNLIFVIGIILTVVGFVRSTSTFAKIAVFGEYPLASYEETRCTTYPSYAPELNGVVVMPEDSKEREKECLETLSKDRKLRMIDDVVTSVSLLISGIVLSFSFRRFIFVKKV